MQWTSTTVTARAEGDCQQTQPTDSGCGSRPDNRNGEDEMRWTPACDECIQAIGSSGGHPPSNTPGCSAAQ